MENYKSKLKEYVAKQLDDLQDRIIKEIRDTVIDRLRGARILLGQASIRLHGLVKD